MHFDSLSGDSFESSHTFVYVPECTSVVLTVPVPRAILHAVRGRSRSPSLSSLHVGWNEVMALDVGKLDEHISSLREGNTLTENEVKALCEKVNYC